MESSTGESSSSSSSSESGDTSSTGDPSSSSSSSSTSSSDGSSTTEASSGESTGGCVGRVIEDWESESFDTHGWTRGGATPWWFIADWPPAVSEGTFAVASDSPPPGSSSWIRTTLELPAPGALTFRFWASVGPEDRLVVIVDGNELAAFVGPHGAASMHVPSGPIDLPAGSMELELRYERGITDVDDYDELFIDEIAICW